MQNDNVPNILAISAFGSKLRPFGVWSIIDSVWHERID